MFDSSELLEKERVDGGSLFKNILQKQEISKAENEIGEEEKGERSLIFDQLQTWKESIRNKKDSLILWC